MPPASLLKSAWRVLLALCASIAAAIPTPAHAQAPARCGHDAYRSHVAGPSIANQARLDKAAERQAGSATQKTTTQPPIPVVVHVIHQGGAENISLAQVTQAIDHLNLAFANAGPYAQANGTATGIQFCLALRDTADNASSGILRVNNPLTNLTLETDDAALKALSIWDPSRYLNIWVVNSIQSLSSGPGVAGYATLPGAHGLDIDGIVVEHNFFGTSPDNSKVLVHEAGHYLGLYHTFEGACANADCQADGDRVCDTPPDGSSGNAPCASAPNTCSTDAQDTGPQNPFRPVSMGGLGDQPDPIDNYMDYGYPNCQVRLTPGQRDRMLFFLANARGSLGASLGCFSPCPTPIAAGFTPAQDTSLPQGASIAFSNASTGATTFTWTLDGVVVSTQASPTILFNQVGTHVLQLRVGNGNPDCADSLSIRVEVLCPVQAGFTASQAQVLPGDTVLFTSTAVGATGQSWLLDGIAIGSGPTFSHTFLGTGGHSLCLATASATCPDTACTYVAVGDCGRKRNNIWTFGDSGHGLDFSGGAPVLVASSINNREEGFSAICSDHGELLCYSDGLNVYRATGTAALGTLMPNGTGLWGGASGSSIQGALFVPKPLDDSILYLFTADEVAGAQNNTYGGVAYSIVDLRAGANGEVVQKNTPLYTPATEKLTAVRHANGCDVWIMTHDFGPTGNSFKAYLLTPSGLNPTPVVSSVGSIHNGGVNGTSVNLNAMGQMRFSPDGSRLALTIYRMGRVEIFDFDKSTGMVSNPITIDYGAQLLGGGVEFSPDGSKLYATINLQRLYQINLNAGNTAAVIASSTLIFQIGGGTFAMCMSLGPDGKIYMASSISTYLHVIHNPNGLGMACNAQVGAIPLPNNSSITVQNAVSDYGRATGGAAHGPLQVCADGAARTYYFDQFSCADSVRWHLPAGAVLLSPQGGSVQVAFATPGTYPIVAEAFSACGHALDTLQVVASAAPGLDLGPDTTLCGGAFTLSAGPGFSSYQWSNGMTSSTIFVFQAGTYSVTATHSSGCRAIDTIVVHPASSASPNLGPDMSICQGGIQVLNPGSGFSSFTWQDNSTGPQYTAFQPGTYWVETRDACGGVGRDTVTLALDASYQVDLGPDTVLCAASIQLSAGAGHFGHLWSTGASTPAITVTQPGVYWVEVLNAQGCTARDSVEVLTCVGLVAAETGKLKIYPVPTEADVWVEIPDAVNGPLGWRVLDALGREVMAGEAGVEAAAKLKLPLGQLPAGLYHVVMQSEGRAWTGRAWRQ